MNEPGPLVSSCCGDDNEDGCVFAKAILSRAAVCEQSSRRQVGEREIVACGSVVARFNCSTLAALMAERARFALRLPGPGRPLMHAQALKLQCGGLVGLQHVLELERPEVQSMVGAALERYASLDTLPWEQIVRSLASWTPRRPRNPAPR